MRKIIKGRSYDTEKATQVAEWENDFGRADFHWQREELYRKRNGEYFVYGEGGPMSAYAERVGYSSRRAGSAILPLTYDEARQWAEDHLDAEDYEAEFGEAPEGDDQEEAVLSVRVPASARVTLDRYCTRTGRAKGEVVAELIATLTDR